MPRDSHLLAPTSRALLRAARAGCIYIRPAPKQPHQETKEPTTDGEEQQSMHMADRSFTARKWTAVPRHLEPAEVEFLAKRRPGLPSLYGASVMGIDGSGEAGAPMRRTRFKKVDPTTGNISIYEAWVPEGHRIEGEITENAQSIASANSEVTVTPETPAPGTVVDGVGVANSEGVVIAEAGSAAVMTPPKRRPPPPKRKGKGIGRGRRKKVMFAPGEGADASTVHGAGPGAVDGAAGDHVKVEGADASHASIDQSGQDDEEEEDGDEGEESDGDESMMDTKTPETPLPQAESEPTGDSAHEPVNAPTVDAGPHSQPDSSTTSQRPAGQQAPPAPDGSPQEKPDAPAAAEPGPSEEKQGDEKASAEDVDMTDYRPSESHATENMTSVPQPAQAAQPPAQEAPTSASENAAQPPEETTQGSQATSLQAQNTDQTGPNEAVQNPQEAVDENATVKQETDEDANPTTNTVSAPEHVPNQAGPMSTDAAADNDAGASGEPHGEQKQEEPANQIEQNPGPEVKEEAEDMVDGHIEAPPAEQSGDQSTENPMEQAAKPTEETTPNQPEAPSQVGHQEIDRAMEASGTQPPEQTTTQPEPQSHLHHLQQPEAQQPTKPEETEPSEPAKQPSPPAPASVNATPEQEQEEPAEPTADAAKSRETEPALGEDEHAGEMGQAPSAPEQS